MDFLELISIFENRIKDQFSFELLELHYAPYAFGSGAKAYRINGRNVKIIFDGREGLVKIEISLSHEKYDRSNWSEIFNGRSIDFVEKGLDEIEKSLKN